MLTRRDFLKLAAATGAGALVPWRSLAWGQPLADSVPVALASVQVPQTPLAGKSIPKFVEPLPTFVGARVTATNLTVSMHEFSQQVLPVANPALGVVGYPQTTVWGYKVNGFGPLYPGYTVEATRGTATTMTYVNSLPTSGSYVQQLLTVDQTLHWAAPLGMDMMNMSPYSGPPPAVVHLHGGEVPSDFDGGPDQWFTPDGIHGPSYRTAAATDPNKAIYTYPNTQEAATLWFHDHTLGATRLNVYAGMAAFYLLRDSRDTGLPDNSIGLPAGPYEIEIAIQDRRFDTAGQLLFPDIGINAMIHPYWIPEFFGDVIVVNGKTWPYLEVEPRRYRFRLLDGSNARFYELRLMNRTTGTPGPAMWVIGTDGGLLDAPVRLNDPANPASPRLLMGPGERYDVIIDFSGFAGQTLTLVNSAKGPFPKGTAPDPQTVGQIMQFRVTKPLQGSDTSYNPVSGGSLRATPIVRLAKAGAVQVTPDATRQLTLNEVMGMAGPLEVLVNNSKWVGKRPDGTPIPGSAADGAGNYMTEMPLVGSTEVWEIVNLTADAHPIHLHLVQFQLINRQSFKVTKYVNAYNAAFPGGTYDGINYAPGVYIPAFGPPLHYLTGTPGKLGGNPDVTPFLQGAAAPALAHEVGWKDTVLMYPGQVTRVVVRFAPQTVAKGATTPGVNQYAFDPTTGPGYVWHCHIVDHEDNEMMRPYMPSNGLQPASAQGGHHVYFPFVANSE